MRSRDAVKRIDAAVAMEAELLQGDLPTQGVAYGPGRLTPSPLIMGAFGLGKTVHPIQELRRILLRTAGRLCRRWPGSIA